LVDFGVEQSFAALEKLWFDSKKTETRLFCQGTMGYKPGEELTACP
jgi:hypothetical protein